VGPPIEQKRARVEDSVEDNDPDRTTKRARPWLRVPWDATIALCITLVEEIRKVAEARNEQLRLAMMEQMMNAKLVRAGGPSAEEAITINTDTVNMATSPSVGIAHLRRSQRLA